MTPRLRIAALALVALSAALGGATRGTNLYVSRIPARPGNAMGGTAFYNLVKDLTQGQRELLVARELAAGNVPGFARSFRPVTVQATVGGRIHRGTFYVMPDYLSIGSSSDFFRMPMTPAVAQAAVDLYGCLLPTRRMVNAIWSSASLKLAPYPLSPSQYDIDHVTTFRYHHDIIELQRYPNPMGPTMGGTKKDVVITPLLVSNPGKVAIYGWHQLNGVPIQPLYLGHGDYYVDYSHGIRPVWGQMSVDGVWRSVASVLADPTLHVLLSDEGVVTRPRYE